MTTSSPRAAVIGLGWAGQQHLAAYAARDDVELVGLAGLEKDRLGALGAQYGIPHTFENWQDLLDGGGIDVLSIAVPTSLHAPIAIQALAQGIHVLCEKPMSATLAEAEAMVYAASSAGRVLEIVFNHRSHGEIKAIKSLVASGALGAPYHTRVTWLRRNGVPAGWFRQRRLAGGGVLTDLGIHLLDYALDMLGEPGVRSVSATGYSAYAQPADGGADDAVEDFASAFIRLGDGSTLQLETSWAAAGPQDDEIGITLHGSQGGARSFLNAVPGPGTVDVYAGPSAPEDDRVVAAPAGEGHVNVIDGFLSVVREGGEFWAAHDGTVALDRTRTIMACYESIASGREVVTA